MSITITPQTSIVLCKTQLENDYKNTFKFNNKTAQMNYFNSLNNKIVAGEDYTYIKKDNIIKVNKPIDEIINYNYLYYTNTGFTNKTYFCFINDMKYINENLTELSIETDVFQTWQFDLVWNRCYVEREHTNDDTIGANTIPELLETGEYIINTVDSVLNDLSLGIIVIAASDVAGGITRYEDRRYNNIYSGDMYYAFTSSEDATRFIEIYERAGRVEAINNMFLVPSSLSENLIIDYTSVTYEGITCNYGKIRASSYAIIQDQKQISMQTTLNGYSPRNNKLKCYPYNFIEITNNCGGSVIYKYELFNGTPKFNVDGCISPGCDIRMYPLNYNKINDVTIGQSGIKYGFNDGINAGKFPVCSWNTDVYINWLTQTSANRNFGVFNDVLQSVGSMATGDLNGAVGGIKNIFGTAAQMIDQRKIPDSTKGNTNNGDIAYATRNTLFQINKKSIKQEYARVIDGYFDMFGYKTNRVKIPNITGRKNWNYVKCIDSNVDGDIPQSDLQTIRNAMNFGITFWHNPANIYNYNLSNSIV